MARPIDRFFQSDDADDNVAVVRFTGCNVSLNELTIQSVRDALLAQADESGNSSLVLDFCNVDYVSSMALGTLVSLQKKLLASGRRLIIRNPRPQVREVFAVTRLDKFLHLDPADPRAEQLPRRRQDRWIEIPCK